MDDKETRDFDTWHFAEASPTQYWKYYPKPNEHIQEVDEDAPAVKIMTLLQPQYDANKIIKNDLDWLKKVRLRRTVKRFLSLYKIKSIDFS